MIFIFILLGYLLFRFVVGFLIPVFRTTRKMREQFSQMNQNPGRPSGSNANYSGPGQAAGGPSPNPDERTPDASKVGEYIDFEEVKP